MSAMLRGIGALAAGLAGGASLSWMSWHAATRPVALEPLIDVHREVYASFASLGVTLDGIALLLAVTATIAVREKPAPMRAAGLASLALILAMGLGVLFIEPMSAKMATWSAATAADEIGMHVRILGWLLTARAVLEGLAGLGLALALIRDRVARSVASAEAPRREAPRTSRRRGSGPGMA